MAVLQIGWKVLLYEYYRILLINYQSQSIRSTATSLTFVPVGPVIISPPVSFNALYASFCLRTSNILMPFFLSSPAVSASAYPPAASVGPSVPSLPILNMAAFLIPSIPLAADSAISRFLPPLPCPVRLTTVSPPAI